MYIVMIATECAPVAKVGGLGDVVFGLSRELEIRGNEVEIILPKYDCMRYDHIFGLCVAYHDLWVPWYGGAVHCTVWFGFVHGRKCFFIEPHSNDSFFDRRTFYGCHDDVYRFAFFSKAALEFMLKAGKRPDIVHCHDWQCGLVPVLLYEIYNRLGMGRIRVCYTIHNFRHQGVTGADILWATGLGRPEYFFRHEQLRDASNPSALNLMKGGIVYSNFVTTVSPHHAWEAKYTDQGCGLGPLLHQYSVKFDGVLNGVDYDTWNPEIDRHIPGRYTPPAIEGKYRNKEALRDRLLIRKGFKPLIAYVGRLDAQKGVHLIEHALFYCISHGAQFVLLGTSPDGDIGARFWRLKHELNDHQDCHLELAYDEELSHLVYAGADMIIVPSMYEPCGLTQMIALKYGTVPLVRAVGGLVDTVFDRDYDWRPAEQRNGYVFHHADSLAIESALVRALGLWFHYPEEFRGLMLNGMRYDYSWNNPGAKYLEIYDWIRDR
jgi:starch synthase